jgi:hypothetical protein
MVFFLSHDLIALPVDRVSLNVFGRKIAKKPHSIVRLFGGLIHLLAAHQGAQQGGLVGIFQISPDG